MAAKSSSGMTYTPVNLSDEDKTKRARKRALKRSAVIRKNKEAQASLFEGDNDLPWR